MADDAFLGRRIGPYTIRSLLGKGGMGRVYLATAEDESEVAVKILPADAESPGGTLAVRFRREIQACLGLRHVHVVRIYDGGSEEDCDWFAMELLDGTTLQEEQKARGRLPREEAIRIAREIGEALEYIHSKGVVHRDLKPANVMIVRSGRSVLMDFGLAKIQDRTRITKTGHGLGTPRYMAPEMLHGKDTGPWTDVYQLGLILYEMLSGKSAVRAKSFATLAHELTHVYPPRLSKFDPELPKAIDDLVFNCLEKDAGVRYQAAREFLDDLARAERGETVRVRSAPDPLTPSGDQPTVTGLTPESTPAGAAPRRSSSRPSPAVAPAPSGPRPAVPAGTSGPAPPGPAPGRSPTSPSGPAAAVEEGTLSFSLSSFSSPAVVQSAGRGFGLAALLLGLAGLSAWFFAPRAASDTRLAGPVRIQVSPKGAVLEFETLAEVQGRVRVTSIDPAGAEEVVPVLREYGSADGKGGFRHRLVLGELPGPRRYLAELLFPDGSAHHKTPFEIPGPPRLEGLKPRWVGPSQADLVYRLPFPVTGKVRYRVSSGPGEVDLPSELRAEGEVRLPLERPFESIGAVVLDLQGAAGWTGTFGPFDLPGLDGQVLDALHPVDVSAELAGAETAFTSAGAGGTATRSAPRKVSEALGRRLGELGVIGTLAALKPHAGEFFASPIVAFARKRALFERLQDLEVIDLYCRARGAPPLVETGPLFRSLLEVTTRPAFEWLEGQIPPEIVAERREPGQDRDLLRPREVPAAAARVVVERSITAVGPRRGEIPSARAFEFRLPTPVPAEVHLEVRLRNFYESYFLEARIDDRLRVLLWNPRTEPGLRIGPDLPRPESLPVTRLACRLPVEAIQGGPVRIEIELRSVAGIGDYATLIERVAVYHRDRSRSG